MLFTLDYLDFKTGITLRFFLLPRVFFPLPRGYLFCRDSCGPQLDCFFVCKKVKENIVHYKNLTFSKAWTVVDVICNFLPTVTAKHLSADPLQMFQDGGKWWSAAEPFTAFSYSMVHLGNSFQPPMLSFMPWGQCYFFLPWVFHFCRNVILFVVRFFFCRDSRGSNFLKIEERGNLW